MTLHSPHTPAFFSIDTAIDYEGPNSNNPLAYRWYNKDRVIAGRRMEDHLRFAICYWHSFCWHGNDPFGGTLDEVVKSGQAHGRLLQVKRLKSGDRIGDCQILFVSRSETGNIESFLQDLGQQPVLTVGDAEGDAARGLMINLIVVKGSVKMEINRQRAEQSHLQISSKLLGLAKIVESEK